MALDANPVIEDLSDENRVFAPPSELVASPHAPLAAPVPGAAAYQGGHELTGSAVHEEIAVSSHADQLV